MDDIIEESKKPNKKWLKAKGLCVTLDDNTLKGILKKITPEKKEINIRRV